MRRPEDFTTVEELLDEIAKTAERCDPVSLDMILDMVGQRSFGPLLLIAGIIVLAPLIGDIPGVPTAIAVAVILISVQLLLHHSHFWLPLWLRNRSITAGKLPRIVEHLRKPARFIDRLSRPRLTLFVDGAAIHLIAIACIVIAAAMPVMEFVPFSANAAGITLSLFGLSLISRDGLLSLFAFTILFLLGGILIYSFQ